MLASSVEIALNLFSKVLAKFAKAFRNESLILSRLNMAPFV